MKRFASREERTQTHERTGESGTVSRRITARNYPKKALAQIASALRSPETETGVTRISDASFSQSPGLMKKSNLRWVCEEQLFGDWMGGVFPSRKRGKKAKRKGM